MMSMAQQQAGGVCHDRTSGQQFGCLRLTIPQQQVQAISSPASSTDTVMSSGTALASPHSAQSVGIGHTHQQQQQQIDVAGLMPRSTGSGYSREWLYRLVTFPSYFTPCVSCCDSNRAPKREQLMTQFDTVHHKVYCSHCPEVKSRADGSLLQVRRSAFKDVVKATDILRFGCDVAGVQQYTLNGSKVIYLNREQAPERKGSSASTAPAVCSVCNRSMMDKSSAFCSLKCKMHAEDSAFNQWLDVQDPSVRIAAMAYANAPPRPTVACKRVQPSSSTSSGDDNSTDTCSRPNKAARTSSAGATVGACAGDSAAHGSCGESAAPVAAVAYSTAGVPGMGSRVMVAPPGLSAFAGAAQQQQPGVTASVQRAGSGTLPARGHCIVPPVPAGMKPIRASLPARQNSAPSAFLEAAMEDPLLGPTTQLASASWLPCPEELDSGSAWGSWDSAFSSPSFDVLDDAWASEDGSISPDLILGSSAGSSAGDWWVGSSSSAAESALLPADLEEACLLEGCLLVPGSPNDDHDMFMLGAHNLSGAVLMC